MAHFLNQLKQKPGHHDRRAGQHKHRRDLSLQGGKAQIFHGKRHKRRPGQLLLRPLRHRLEIGRDLKALDHRLENLPLIYWKCFKVRSILYRLPLRRCTLSMRKDVVMDLESVDVLIILINFLEPV